MIEIQGKSIPPFCAPTPFNEKWHMNDNGRKYMTQAGKKMDERPEAQDERQK